MSKKAAQTCQRTSKKYRARWWEVHFREQIILYYFKDTYGAENVKWEKAEILRTRGRKG